MDRPSSWTGRAETPPQSRASIRRQTRGRTSTCTPVEEEECFHLTQNTHYKNNVTMVNNDLVNVITGKKMHGKLQQNKCLYQNRRCTADLELIKQTIELGR